MHFSEHEMSSDAIITHTVEKNNVFTKSLDMERGRGLNFLENTDKITIFFKIPLDFSSF